MVPVPQEQQNSPGSGIRFRAGRASLVCGVVVSDLGRSEGSLRAFDWCKVGMQGPLVAECGQGLQILARTGWIASIGWDSTCRGWFGEIFGGFDWFDESYNLISKSGLLGPKW